jgi:hypothetical protein
MDREILSRARGAYVMPLKPVMFFAASFAAALLAALPQATAGGSGGGTGIGTTNYGNISGGPHCQTGSTLIINKPVTINKNVSIYKPVTIEKNIDINKNINIDKSVTITKNIDASKHISIYKNIVINKGGGTAEASAFASAMASASASASASANVTVYNGSYQDVRVVNNNGGGEVSVSAEETCQMQEATVMKAIHAICLAGDREFAASHMLPETFIDSSYEGEVARCLPGAILKVIIGDVLQSDQGMAGTYEHGQVLQCAAHEALHHYKDGMLKCAPEVPVKDCTERTNLRLYGTSDFFFTFRTQVCASAAKSASVSRSVEVTGMPLDGGVGADSGY